MSGKVCDEITYPFTNFNGTTVEVWEWISHFITHIITDVITYTCCDWNSMGLADDNVLHTFRWLPAVFNTRAVFSRRELPLCRYWSVVFRHDDVIKWKHFPHNWPFVRGIHRSRWIPRTKGQWRGFDVFFDLHLNKRLSKQPWGWWFETPSW